MNPVLVFMLAILAFSLHAPLRAAQWNVYPYTDTYRRACHMGEKIYLLKGNTLAQADCGNWKIEKNLTREDGLSGSNIFDILYSTAAKRLVVVYEDGLIDVLLKNGEIWTITDLYSTPMAGFDKTINGVREQQGHLYISTAFGFVVVDLFNEAMLHSFNLNKSVNCAWSYNNDWYYSNDEGTFYCAKSGNPYNPQNWKLGSDHSIRQVIIAQNKGKEQCWQVAKDQALRKIEAPSHSSVRCTSSGKVRSIEQFGSYIVSFGTDSLSLYDTTFGSCPNQGKAFAEGQRRVCTNSSSYLSTKTACPIETDSVLHIAFLFSTDGLESDSLSLTSNSFKICKSKSQRLLINNRQQSSMINRLVYDGVGEVAMSYVAATVAGYSYQMKTSGFLTTYDSQGEWHNYSDAIVKNGLAGEDQARFVGLLDFIPDPLHEKRYWFSSLEDGIIGIDHGEFLTRYRKYNTNAGLDNYASGCTRVAGLAFSPEGDLWCINDGISDILRVRKESNGKWYHFNIPGLEKSYGFTHLLHTRQGGRHQIWACQEFKYSNSSVFCYDYGTDLTNSSDDRSVSFLTHRPVESTPFVPYYGRGIFEGPNGAIWLLNTSGLYVIDEPDSIFSHPGEVRTVLADVIPTAMTADNQNHLWVSTEQHGIYLLSTDGREQLTHLTTENSQLPSNEVLSVVFDSKKSTLWIACQGYLLSYYYDESEYGGETGWTSTAWCYPGEIAAGSDATIQVFDVAEETEIVLQNSQGRILSSAFTWGNHATLDAKRLPVGSYSIIGTDSAGHRGKICSLEVY